MRTQCVVLVAVLALAGPALGQTVMFDNGGPNYLNGNEMTNWTQAEDFELPQGAVIGAVTLSVLDTTATFPANWDGTLDWWIYTDSAGLPGSVVASGPAQNISYTFDQTIGPGSFYDFRFDLGTPVSLSGGTRYWLALHMASDWANRDNLYWSTTSPGGYNAGTEDLGGGGGWASNGTEHAFALLGGLAAIPTATGAGLAVLIALLAGAGVLVLRRLA